MRIETARSLGSPHWRVNMGSLGYREGWTGTRETFAPSFRAEIDRIVAEVGG